MASLPVIPKCLSITLIGNDGGDFDIRNKTYWAFTGVLSSTDLQTIANEAFTVWGTHMAGVIGQWFTLTGALARDESTKSTMDGLAAGTIAGTGNTAATKLSSGAAFVLSFEGATKYRGGHSRIYIPAQSNLDLTDANSFSAGHATNTVNAWVSFRNALIAAIPTAVGVLSQVIAHRFGRAASSPVLSESPEVPSVPLANPFTEPIVAIRGNLSVGSQRRRNLFVG